MNRTQSNYPPPPSLPATANKQFDDSVEDDGDNDDDDEDNERLV